MSLSRFGAVFRLELATMLRRPQWWIFVVLLLLVSWGLGGGNLTISTGNSAVGRHQGLAQLAVQPLTHDRAGRLPALHLLRSDRIGHVDPAR